VFCPYKLFSSRCKHFSCSAGALACRGAFCILWGGGGCHKFQVFTRNASKELDVSNLGYVVPREEEKSPLLSLRVGEPVAGSLSLAKLPALRRLGAEGGSC